MPNFSGSVHSLLDWSEWPSQAEARRLKVHIDAAATAIAKVHVTPAMPRILVKATTESTRKGGYAPTQEADESEVPVIRHINVSARGVSPRLTFVHE